MKITQGARDGGRWLVTSMALVLAAVLLVITAPAAAAQTPTPTPAPGEFGYGSCINSAIGRTTTCTAGDLRYGSFQVLDIDGRCTDTNSSVTVTMKGLVMSNTTRSDDVAFWVNVKGGNAVTDSTANACYRHVLNPNVTSPYTGVNLTSGEGPYKSADGDFCGDALSGDGYNHVNFAPMSLPCVDTNGNGALDFSICLSWSAQQNSRCNGYQDALPLPDSKCMCETGNVDIPVTTLRMTIAKSCTPSILPYDSPNRTIACTITYNNNSSIAATGFQLVDDYDQAKGSVSNISNPGPGTDNGDTITWTLPTVAAGGSGSVTYNYTINTDLTQGTVIQNTARLYFRVGTTGPYTLQDIASSQSILLGSPLAVTLASFTAAATADGVTLAWETVSETDNAGFNVYRAESDATPSVVTPFIVTTLVVTTALAAVGLCRRK